MGATAQQLSWEQYLQAEVAPLQRRTRGGKGVKIALIGGAFRKMPDVIKVKSMADFFESTVFDDEFGLTQPDPNTDKLLHSIREIAPSAEVTFTNVVDPDTGRAYDGRTMGAIVAARQSGAKIIVSLMTGARNCNSDCGLCGMSRHYAESGGIFVCGPGRCPRADVDGVISVAPLVPTGGGLTIPVVELIEKEAKLAALGQNDSLQGSAVAVVNVAGVIALLLSGRKRWWHTAIPDIEQELKAACKPLLMRDQSWRIAYGLLSPRMLLNE